MLSSPQGTEMFQFPCLPSQTYRLGLGFPMFNREGCPIRVPPDHCLLAAPRSFSQLAAPFFGCFCLGIHRAPLVACTPPISPRSFPHFGDLGRDFFSRRSHHTGSSSCQLRARLRALPHILASHLYALVKVYSPLASLPAPKGGYPSLPLVDHYPFSGGNSLYTPPQPRVNHRPARTAVRPPVHKKSGGAHPAAGGP